MVILFKTVMILPITTSARDVYIKEVRRPIGFVSISFYRISGVFFCFFLGPECAGLPVAVHADALPAADQLHVDVL